MTRLSTACILAHHAALDTLMPVNRSLTLAPLTDLDIVVFRVDDQAFTRLDVLRWAERHDDLFAERVRRRLALARRAAEDEPAESVVEEAAANFRYERGLEDADAMQRWLEQRQVSVEAWWEALRRSVLETFPATASTDEDPCIEDDGMDNSVGESWRADLCATDLLDAATLDLARHAAVFSDRDPSQRLSSGVDGAATASPVVVPWPALGVDVERLAECDVRLDTLAGAWESWRSGIVTATALKTLVDHHRLEWLVVDVVMSWWPTADAAREAIWCVTDDAQTLEFVSREARRPVESSVLLLEDSAAQLHDLLLAAAPGDVVGPVAVGAQWVVVSVKDKRPPSLADPRVRSRAERALDRSAAADLLERLVVWPERRA